MTKMCSIIYSVFVFLLMTTSMNSYEERVCDLIFSEGKLRDFGVYKRFDTNNTPSYWLFVRDGDNTVGADKEYELKLDVDWNITIIPKGVDTSPAIHKFSIQSIHYNCSVQRQGSGFLTICTSVHPGKDQKIDNSTDFGDSHQSIVVQPLTNTEFVFVFQRNDKRSYFGYYPFMGTPRQEIHGDWGLPQHSTQFVKKTEKTLFSKLMGVLPMIGRDERYLLIFNISGRPKYCFSIEKSSNYINNTNECNSTEYMRPFLPECQQNITKLFTEIETEFDSIDPMFWVLIALTIIAVILSLAVWAAILYRQRRQRALDRAAYERTANATTMDTIPTTKSDYKK